MDLTLSFRAAEALLQHAARNGVQHSVQELHRLRRPVVPRDLQRLVDHDGGRRVGAAKQLRDSRAQQVAVHHRHALQPPVLRMCLDQRVDLHPALGGHAINVLGKAARLRIHVVARGPEEPAHLLRRLLAQVALEEHLHRQFAGLAARSHLLLPR